LNKSGNDFQQCCSAPDGEPWRRGRLKPEIGGQGKLLKLRDFTGWYRQFLLFAAMPRKTAPIFPAGKQALMARS
jgi:hypothetical protein